MLKPEKKWVVGERQFTDYHEAQKFASEKRVVNLRVDLNTLIGENIDIDWKNHEWNLNPVVDEILKHYILKPQVAK